LDRGSSYERVLIIVEDADLHGYTKAMASISSR